MTGAAGRHRSLACAATACGSSPPFVIADVDEVALGAVCGEFVAAGSEVEAMRVPRSLRGDPRAPQSRYENPLRVARNAAAAR